MSDVSVVCVIPPSLLNTTTLRITEANELLCGVKSG